MNIIKVQQTFKRLPDEKVAEYVRDPALGFIALMELNERKKERDAYQAQSQQPDVSLAESIPQELGIMSGAAPSAPPTTMPAIQPMQPMQPPVQQPMQQPMQQPVGMAGGGIVAFSNGGSTEEEQRKKDRERIMGGLESLGAAAADVITLIPRGIAGAAESAITRPLRALGVDIPYLPEGFYGGDRSSMTPYYDQLRRQRGEDTEQRPKPEQAQVRKTEPVVQVPTPTRTTTPGGPTPAKPAPAGLAAIPGVPAVQTLDQMIDAAKTGGEKIGKVFPDKVSPLMEEYQKYLQGKKISEDEARREGFRQFGLKALQGTSRDFFQNIGAAGEAGMGAYKAIQEKNSQIQDTIMQQKIALAQAKEARDRGNFDAAMRLNDKAQALGLQRYGLEVEKAKAEDAMKTSAVQRRLYETKIDLAPLQAAAAIARSQGAGNIKPTDYARVLKDFEATSAYRDLLKSAQEAIANKYGKDTLKTAKGQAALRDLVQPAIQEQVFLRLGVDPSKAKVGYTYSSKDTDED
jgi:hypothetical protein